MRHLRISKLQFLLGGVLAWNAFAQSPPTAEALGISVGIPPRTAPADYQAKAVAGSVTIAADFVGHAVPTPQGMFTSEEYVVVEAAFYGPADAKLRLSWEDFSIRLNDKKGATPATQFGVVFRSLKDPEWQPPVPKDDGGGKSKGGVSTGGGGQSSDPKPLPPKMPFPLQRAMEQKVQKAALPEGERALPQAGLLFFRHGGKAESIRTIELIYSGAAGKASLTFEQ